MIVSGEFRITNEPFRSALYNLSSPDFKQLSKRIQKEVCHLGSKNEEWNLVGIVEIGPDIDVDCSF